MLLAEVDGNPRNPRISPGQPAPVIATRAFESFTELSIHPRIGPRAAVEEVVVPATGDELTVAACHEAGRNLSIDEWRRFVGADNAYRPTCPPDRRRPAPPN